MKTDVGPSAMDAMKKARKTIKRKKEQLAREEEEKKRLRLEAAQIRKQQRINNGGYRWVLNSHSFDTFLRMNGNKRRLWVLSNKDLFSTKSSTAMAKVNEMMAYSINHVVCYDTCPNIPVWWFDISVTLCGGSLRNTLILTQKTLNSFPEDRVAMAIPAWMHHSLLTRGKIEDKEDGGDNLGNDSFDLEKCVFMTRDGEERTKKYITPK